MSYMHRKRQREAAQIAEQHEWYETPDGNPEAWSNDIDGIVGVPDGYSPSFPGPRETRFLDSQNKMMQDNAVGTIRDFVDWDIGGVPGLTKFVGSEGVTDPQTVDRHDFQGEMAVIRRLPDTNYGPVAGGSDTNALLSLLYQMQETNAYFPNEVSQADMIRAV